MLVLPLSNWAVLSRPSPENDHDVGGEPGLASGEGLGLDVSIFSHCDQRKYFSLFEASLNFLVSKNDVSN